MITGRRRSCEALVGWLFTCTIVLLLPITWRCECHSSRHLFRHRSDKEETDDSLTSTMLFELPFRRLESDEVPPDESTIEEKRPSLQEKMEQLISLGLTDEDTGTGSKETIQQQLLYRILIETTESDLSLEFVAALMGVGSYRYIRSEAPKATSAGKIDGSARKPCSLEKNLLGRCYATHFEAGTCDFCVASHIPQGVDTCDELEAQMCLAINLECLDCQPCFDEVVGFLNCAFSELVDCNITCDQRDIVPTEEPTTVALPDVLTIMPTANPTDVTADNSFTLSPSKIRSILPSEVQTTTTAPELRSSDFQVKPMRPCAIEKIALGECYSELDDGRTSCDSCVAGSIPKAVDTCEELEQIMCPVVTDACPMCQPCNAELVDFLDCAFGQLVGCGLSCDLSSSNSIGNSSTIIPIEQPEGTSDESTAPTPEQSTLSPTMFPTPAASTLISNPDEISPCVIEKVTLKACYVFLDREGACDPCIASILPQSADDCGELQDTMCAAIDSDCPSCQLCQTALTRYLDCAFSYLVGCNFDCGT